MIKALREIHFQKKLAGHDHFLGKKVNGFDTETAPFWPLLQVNPDFTKTAIAF